MPASEAQQLRTAELLTTFRTLVERSLNKTMPDATHEQKFNASLEILRDLVEAGYGIYFDETWRIDGDDDSAGR
jgi:hypothetical protein